MQAREDAKLKAMRREADQEAAALARRAKDEALAEAMRASHERDDHPRGSSTEGVARCSSEVKGGRGPRRLKTEDSACHVSTNNKERLLKP